MGRALIAVSETLHEFLEGRLNARADDEELAYRFLTHRIDDADPEARNYFDVRSVRDAPSITYSSLSAWTKAQIKNEAASVYEIGGHRAAARPGAAAQRVTGITDGKVLDAFSTAVRAFLGESAVVQVVRGPAITRYYNGRNYCRCVNLGELGNSCMRYDGYNERFALYEDIAEMAVIICPTCAGVRARALLWTDVAGKRWVDRVYGTNVTREQILVWAREQGYERLWSGHDGIGRHKVTVAAPSKPYIEAPYVDSLPYWCRTCGTLRDAPCPERSHDLVTLRSVHGTTHQGWFGRCPECFRLYRDGHRTCSNRKACAGCGEETCAEACPNGCWLCRGCYGMQRKGAMTCGQGCLSCPSCENIQNPSITRLHHGHCRYCSSLIVALTVPEAPLAPVARGWRGVCPECQGTIDLPRRGVTTTSGLYGCAEVHAAPDPVDGCGHCPGCMAPLRWAEAGEHPMTPDPERMAISDSMVEAIASWERAFLVNVSEPWPTTMTEWRMAGRGRGE